MKNPVPIISLLLMSLMILNMCSENNTANKEHNMEYVKYFLKRNLIPNENFNHIDTRFTKEIKASSNEIILKIKAVEKEKGQFYKVFYNKNKQITKYQFFKENKLISSSIYRYGTNKETMLQNKVIKIEYHDPKGNMTAYERINYNKAGQAIRSKRYTKLGNVVNLF